eukprot:4276049-Amphidinium_carterae.1
MGGTEKGVVIIGLSHTVQGPNKWAKLQLNETLSVSLWTLSKGGTSRPAPKKRDVQLNQAIRPLLAPASLAWASLHSEPGRGSAARNRETPETTLGTSSPKLRSK